MTLRITVCTNGPLVISGDDAAALELRAHDGTRIAPRSDGGPIALCRCGASLAKPFCDGSHRSIQFVGSEAPRMQHDLVVGEDLAERRRAAERTP